MKHNGNAGWDYFQFMAIPTQLAAQIISEHYTLIKKGE